MYMFPYRLSILLGEMDDFITILIFHLTQESKCRYIHLQLQVFVKIF